MWLATPSGQQQARLNGFKSRALRVEAPTQRHLYAAEWRAIDEADGATGAQVLTLSGGKSVDCERLASRAPHADWLSRLSDGESAAVALAVAMQRASLAAGPLFGLEVALALVQTQAATMPLPKMWLITMGSPTHEGSWGLARAARAEASLPVHCIDGAAAAALEQRQPLAEPEAMLGAAACLVPRLARARESTHATNAPAASTHVVTGGTGGLGLLTARWLAQRGAARALALASRSGGLARDTAGDWAGVRATTGVVTLVQRCDTAEGTSVGRLVAHVTEAASAMGVWHVAGVLADGLLARQSAAMLARVYGPKAHAAWGMQRGCAALPVRSCALFSSVAALLGGAGQANYAAANSCLDALALARRAAGSAGVSVQWGPWALSLIHI